MNRTINNSFIKRGELYYADLSEAGVTGSEQGGVRPILIIQNDMGNKHSPTVIIAAITSSTSKKNIPTHVKISSTTYGLKRDSIVLLEQVKTIDKSKLKDRIGYVDMKVLEEVDDAIAISLGLKSKPTSRPVKNNISRSIPTNTIRHSAPCYV